MKLKVKQKELNDVVDVMKKGGDDYDTEIDNMLEQIEKLRHVWIGTDATVFCDNVEGYITKMKNIPICLRNMSKYTKEANAGYKEKDDEYAKELNKEATNYDEPNANNKRDRVSGDY